MFFGGLTEMRCSLCLEAARPFCKSWNSRPLTHGRWGACWPLLLDSEPRRTRSTAVRKLPATAAAAATAETPRGPKKLVGGTEAASLSSSPAASPSGLNILAISPTARQTQQAYPRHWLRSFNTMAGPSFSSTADIDKLLRQYYPSVSAPSTASSSPATVSKQDLAAWSTAIFPGTTYTEAEQEELAGWVEKAQKLAGQAHGSSELQDLNTHLSSRTTILDTKPSAADAIVYTAVAPLLQSWTPEQRTGETGYHHIVRYADFVQSAPFINLSIPQSDRILINPDEVVFRPKPVDLKAEKERKKKEKLAAAAGASAAAGETAKQLPTRGGPESKVELAKQSAGNVVEAVKAKGAEAAAAVGAAVAGAKKDKKEKKEKKPKQPAAPAAPEKPLGPNLIDLRVGHILKCERHPNADSLYVSTMDVGDAEGTKETWKHEETGKIVRTVCSGLNGLVPLESMQNRRVVAVCNLKPVKMRGITSSAMVLAASPRLFPGEEDNHAGPVELVEVPAGAAAGTRVAFEGFDNAEADGGPEPQLNPKKKVWEAMQVGFTTVPTDSSLSVAFDRSRTEVLSGDKGAGKPEVGKLHVLGSNGGPCTVPTLKDAVVR